MVDPSVLSKFLVNTLEGEEPIRSNAIVCVGEYNDMWQQTPKKLLSAYIVGDITDDGWMVCIPKTGNAVDCHEVTSSDTNNGSEFSIIGTWGKTLDDGTKNVQFGAIGDYVCRDPNNHTDQWIVRRKIFDNTYAVK